MGPFVLGLHNAFVPQVYMLSPKSQTSGQVPLELHYAACFQPSLLGDFIGTAFRPVLYRIPSSAHCSGSSSLTYFEFSGLWAS